MKIYPLLLILIILVGCQDYDKTNIKKVGIYKEIKSYKIEDFKVSDKKEKDTFQTKIFDYNNKGQLARSIIISHKINSEYITRFKYNSKNEIIKEIGTVTDLKEPIVVEYKRINDTLRTFQSKILDKEDSILYEINGKDIYNSKNELKNTKTENFFINLKTNDTTYDYKSESFYKNGFVYKTEWIYYDTLTNSSVYNYTRDDNNLLIKLIEIVNNKGEQKESIYKYEYDEYGSWIKQSVIENGEIVRIIEREINYK